MHVDAALAGRASHPPYRTGVLSGCQRQRQATDKESPSRLKTVAIYVKIE
jgi:hypothetical protein